MGKDDVISVDRESKVGGDGCVSFADRTSAGIKGIPNFILRYFFNL
jgi:hypothetical protein